MLQLQTPDGVIHRQQLKDSCHRRFFKYNFLQSANANAPSITRQEPLQYVLGVWSFRQLELKMQPPVLIPRPETEV